MAWPVPNPSANWLLVTVAGVQPGSNSVTLRSVLAMEVFTMGALSLSGNSLNQGSIVTGIPGGPFIYFGLTPALWGPKRATHVSVGQKIVPPDDE